MGKKFFFVFPKKTEAKSIMLFIYLLFAFIILLEFIADYFFYTWAKNNRTFLLIVGVVLYMIGVIIWAYMMKYEKLSTLGIIYSASTLIISLVLAVVIFHEGLTTNQTIAFILCVFAIILVNF